MRPSWTISPYGFRMFCERLRFLHDLEIQWVVRHALAGIMRVFYFLISPVL